MTPPSASTGPQRINLFWRVVRVVAELIVRVIMRWRVDVRGFDRVPRTGGAVLVYNHHSYFDFVMVAWNIVRKLRRPVRFLAKAEIWNNPFGRFIVDGVLAIPVERGSSSGRVGALAAAEASLRAGDLVAVAPEQTISRSFELLPFRTGAVRMAQAAGVPVIPVVGWGTHRFFTKGHGPHLARRVPVVVEYGEPIAIAADDDPREATERVRGIMVAMLDRIQREYVDPAAASGAWWQPRRLGGGAPDHAEIVAAETDRRTEWHQDDGGEPSSQAS